MFAPVQGTAWPAGVRPSAASKVCKMPRRSVSHAPPWLTGFVENSPADSVDFLKLQRRICTGFRDGRPDDKPWLTQCNDSAGERMTQFVRWRSMACRMLMTNRERDVWRRRSISMTRDCQIVFGAGMLSRSWPLRR